MPNRMPIRIEINTKTVLKSNHKNDSKQVPVFTLFRFHFRFETGFAINAISCHTTIMLADIVIHSVTVVVNAFVRITLWEFFP